MHDTFTSKPVRSATDSYVRDYILAGAALLVGFLAVIYGEYWLAWGASLLFWLAFYDFTRRWPPEKEKNWWRLLVALVLIAATISLIRLKPAKEQRLAAVPQPQEVQTILVRYMPGMLPLSIAPKTTSYVLQLNPQISEGLYEQSNDSSAVTWWPRKPPSKKERSLDQIYVCQFTNYGSKALLDVAVVFDLTFYSVASAHGEFRKNPDGTSSFSLTLPQNEIPGTPNPGIRRMVFGRVINGKVTAISPGTVVSSHKHKAVIPVIPAGGSATIYLVNESKLFAHFNFPTRGDSIVTGDPKKQSIVLIRPDVNIIEKLPAYILPPATYHWVGVPDAP